MGIINDNADSLLQKGYFQNGETKWEDIANRVAKAISNAEESTENREKYNKDFFNIINDLDFIPSTPCLINAGTESQQLSSCFIGELRDNIESIYSLKGDMAKIFQKNGGIGFNISVLRPFKSNVETSKGFSCGTIGFMEEFNLTADIVTRNNMRKGAVKCDLDVWHPDILEFIKCKDDTSKFTFMNISVSIPNRFMEAVENNSDWDLVFPDYSKDKAKYNQCWDGDIEKWISDGNPVKVYQTVKATELYHLIMEHAWKTGEPGVNFSDNMNIGNPNPKLGKTNKTNPCFTGDMKLCAQDGYKTFEELSDTEFNIVNPNGEVSKGKVWCSGQKNTVKVFLTNGEIIKCTPNHIFMLENGAECRADSLVSETVMCYNRENSTVIKVLSNGIQTVYDFTEPNTHWGIVNGVVVHNCAEFVSIPWNSCNLGSINLSHMVNNGSLDYEKIKSTVNLAVRFLDNMITVNQLPLEKIEKITKSVRSIGLGTMGFADMLYKLRIPYCCNESMILTDNLYTFIFNTAKETSIELAKEKGCYSEWKDSKWDKMGIKIRNSNLLSIAPNGSISFIADTSGGIEPNFALIYTRRRNDGEIYYITNKIFGKELKNRGIYSEKLLEKITKNSGSCQGVSEIPEDMQKVFVVASDLTPDEHLEILSSVQHYVDLSVSKTINLSNSATVESVENIYKKACGKRIKGVTIYRDGSRDNQTLSTTREEPKETIIFDSVIPISRKKMGTTHGSTFCKKCACGTLYITINRNENEDIVECFVHTSKGGICQANIGAVNRMISLAMRTGVKIEEITDQLRGINCPACVKTKTTGVQIDGLSCPDIMARTLTEFCNIPKQEKTKISQKCPDCGSEIRREGGCVICSECGYSKCG